MCFFFQAEDGIGDLTVTGVQTCALPISPITYSEVPKKWTPPSGPPLHISVEFDKDGKTVSYPAYRWLRDVKDKKEPKARSEERRVGKEGRSRWSPYH